MVMFALRLDPVEPLSARSLLRPWRSPSRRASPVSRRLIKWYATPFGENSAKTLRKAVSEATCRRWARPLSFRLSGQTPLDGKGLFGDRFAPKKAADDRSSSLLI